MNIPDTVARERRGALGNLKTALKQAYVDILHWKTIRLWTSNVLVSTSLKYPQRTNSNRTAYVTMSCILINLLSVNRKSDKIALFVFTEFEYLCCEWNKNVTYNKSPTFKRRQRGYWTIHQCPIEALVTVQGADINWRWAPSKVGLNINVQNRSKSTMLIVSFIRIPKLLNELNYL